IRDAEGFPYFVRGARRHVAGRIGEPLVVRVAEHQQRAGRDERRELVMIERQLVDEIREAAKVLAEPGEVRVAERLDVAERLRDAPGCAAAAARLLRDRERDT